MSAKSLEGFDSASPESQYVEEKLDLDPGDAKLPTALSDGPRQGFTGPLMQWLGGEAGTNWDGWLLTVASQIGQILLTFPNAYAKVSTQRFVDKVKLLKHL
ncbi:hypothetical protein WJX73_005462 [Symbiochloris irregularis]|uniref:Uncharacterized protein n=1 Tax=Symbiochloris irregularis TaxID=706552 RepID=A0AAW1NM97_9CHLO